MSKANTATRVRKKIKKVVTEGVAHVHASFNNTIITNIGSLKEMKNEDWELPIM